MRKIVEQYWSGVARRLQEEVETFNKLIGHAGEQGRENEISLVRLMENLLPTSVGVGSGMIIDSEGGVSKQTDIIIYDSGNQPSILAQTTQAIYPVENVLMTIEVKTTLNEEELNDCAEKQRIQTALKPANGSTAPPMAVLAYNAEGMLSTVASRIREIDENVRPLALCVVKPGILAGSRKVVTGNGNNDYIVGLAALHAFDALGDRISGKWQKPEQSERGRILIRSGIPYPVARETTKNESRLLGEPGRALLMFCSVILDTLTSASTLPQSTLKYYLQGPARELHFL
ncbi:DUF6602 domain-containing protein [Streptomyces scabiei]|uniref:DUF6602 domain-containing protein n=1 Tax=Streptomyces scabiei TaxID=1930 RepID=UPI00131D6F78|nr:DUF6602 domain-containing protein [Streptomyces scabiei]